MRIEQAERVTDLGDDLPRMHLLPADAELD